MVEAANDVARVLGIIGGTSVIGGMMGYLGALIARSVFDRQVKWADWIAHGSMITAWGITIFLIAYFILG